MTSCWFDLWIPIWYHLLIQFMIQVRHEENNSVVAFTATLPLIPTTHSCTVESMGKSLIRSSVTTISATTTTSSDAMSTDLTSSINTVPKKGILYDVPVSNNGARCRLILYKKGITSDDVLIQPPSVIGGLQSDLYRTLNPLCKMPLFVCTNHNDNDDDEDNDRLLNIAESDTIARYLLHEYDHVGPSFQPNNVRSNLIVRIHDMYITTIQGCLYKAKPPFGIYYTRKDAIQEFVKQLYNIEKLIVPSNGVYLCGNEVSLADATVYPTMVFASYMLPKFDILPVLPPKLQQWYEQITTCDADFAKIQNEILGALHIWDNNHRWDTILGAGWRDLMPSTIFDQIVAGTIPARIVEQSDDQILAFHDVNPIAPAHVLLIPKERYSLTRLSDATSEHIEILGRLLVTAASIAQNETLGFGPNGYRIVINDGMYGGQEVMHLHVHLIGGRQMSWPPG
jgi:diadenosine tetraphosphate (Ap4A) HIT family hydrolase/glutathione S-transferase